MYSHRKRLLMLPPLILLGLAAALLLTACGGNTNVATNISKAAANQQILVQPISGYSDIQTLDPALANEIPALNVDNMLYSGLVQLNNKLQVQGELASSYSVAPDGTTWTFKLKPNLTFSDGQPLTSADVAYSIDRALEPTLKSSVSSAYLGLIKDAAPRNHGEIKTLIGDSLLTPDKQTIIIKTSKPAAYFLQTLTYQCSFVVEKSLIDKYGNDFSDHLNEGIGGSGPWMVSQYIHNKEIDFVANPKYFGPKPQLKKVVMPFVSEGDTTYKLYQSNQVDSAPIPSTQIANARSQLGTQFHQQPLLDVYYLSLNYLAKPFDNIKIRQAFDLAINKDAIAHNVFHDMVIPTNHIVPSGMPGYNANLTGPQTHKGTTSDVQLARQLFNQGLKEEGLTLADLPPITFTTASQGSADKRNEYSALQQMWKSALGVNVKIDDIDLTRLYSERSATVNNPNGLQLHTLDWIADYPDPQNWLTLLFDGGSPKNAGNYGQNHTSNAIQQQANQRLLEQADVNQNPTERLKQYNQAEQALINDVAWIPIYQNTNVLARKSCVVGIVDNAQNMIPPADWGNIYISTATPCANTSQYQ